MPSHCLVWIHWHLRKSANVNSIDWFMAPSLPIRVDQAVMPTPPGRSPPPYSGGGGQNRVYCWLMYIQVICHLLCIEKDYLIYVKLKASVQKYWWTTAARLAANDTRTLLARHENWSSWPDFATSRWYKLWTMYLTCGVSRTAGLPFAQLVGWLGH